jgi:hypothetical protein
VAHFKIAQTIIEIFSSNADNHVVVHHCTIVSASLPLCLFSFCFKHLMDVEDIVVLDAHYNQNVDSMKQILNDDDEIPHGMEH